MSSFDERFHDIECPAQHERDNKKDDQPEAVAHCSKVVQPRNEHVLAMSRCAAGGCYCAGMPLCWGYAVLLFVDCGWCSFTVTVFAYTVESQPAGDSSELIEACVRPANG